MTHDLLRAAYLRHARALWHEERVLAACDEARAAIRAAEVAALRGATADVILKHLGDAARHLDDYAEALDYLAGGRAVVEREALAAREHVRRAIEQSSGRRGQ